MSNVSSKYSDRLRLLYHNIGCTCGNILILGSVRANTDEIWRIYMFLKLLLKYADLTPVANINIYNMFLSVSFDRNQE